MRDGKLEVSFPFDSKTVAAIKDAVPKRDRRFDKTSRVWIVAPYHLATLARLFPKFAIAPQLAERLRAGAFDDVAPLDVLVARWRALGPAARKARLATLGARRGERRAAWERRLGELRRELGDPRAPLADGRALHDYQAVAASQMLEWGRALLADEMGLGKSLTALAAARPVTRVFAARVLVLAPADSWSHWQREASALGLSVELHSWGKIPDPPDGPFVLIADEVQLVQTLSSARGRRFVALARPAVAFYGISGTPLMHGRPANLFPLLLAAGHELADDPEAYARRYCDADELRLSVGDFTGASNLEEFRRRLEDLVIRREKSEVIALPKKHRRVHRVPETPEARRLFDETFTGLRDEYLARVACGHITRGREEDVLLTHLRHANSVAKTVEAVRLAREVIDREGRVVLFTAFRESARRISVALDCPLLDGGVAAKKRRHAIDGFQAGEHRALVSTFGTGGVAVTRTRARTGLLVDRPFSAEDAQQAEDRLHRITQQFDVLMLWLQFGETDACIDRYLEKKWARSQAVIGRGRGSNRLLLSEHAEAVEIVAELRRLGLLPDDRGAAAA